MVCIIGKQLADVPRNVFGPRLYQRAEIIVARGVKRAQRFFIARHVAASRLHEAVCAVAAIACRQPATPRTFDEPAERGRCAARLLRQP